MECWVLIKTDRKKAGVLGTLMLVLVVLVGRGALQAGLRQSQASSDSATTGATSATTEKNGVSWSKLADDARKRGPTILVEEPEPVTRDVFAVNEEHFPPPPQTDQSDKVGQKSKAGSVEVDVEPRAETPEERQRRIRQEATALRLKSTIVGRSPTAVLEIKEDGKLRSIVLRPDQEVLGFSIRAIHSHAVLLEKEGVQVKLRVELPE